MSGSIYIVVGEVNALYTWLFTFCGNHPQLSNNKWLVPAISKLNTIIAAGAHGSGVYASSALYKQQARGFLESVIKQKLKTFSSKLDLYLRDIHGLERPQGSSSVWKLRSRAVALQFTLGTPGPPVDQVQKLLVIHGTWQGGTCDLDWQTTHGDGHWWWFMLVLMNGWWIMVNDHQR